MARITTTTITAVTTLTNNRQTVVPPVLMATSQSNGNGQTSINMQSQCDVTSMTDPIPAGISTNMLVCSSSK